MRPTAVVTFERLKFATLLLGVVQSYLSWDQAVRIASVGFILTVQVLTFLLLGGLTLLVARRRSKIAMWVLIVLFILGLPAIYGVASRGLMLGSGWITLAQTAGQIIAYGLLFTQSSRSWLNREN